MITYPAGPIHCLQFPDQITGERQIQTGVQGLHAVDEVLRMGTPLSRRHNIALLAHTHAHDRLVVV